MDKTAVDDFEKKVRSKALQNMADPDAALLDEVGDQLSAPFIAETSTQKKPPVKEPVYKGPQFSPGKDVAIKDRWYEAPNEIRAPKKPVNAVVPDYLLSAVVGMGGKVPQWIGAAQTAANVTGAVPSQSAGAMNSVLTAGLDPKLLRIKAYDAMKGVVQHDPGLSNLLTSYKKANAPLPVEKTDAVKNTFESLVENSNRAESTRVSKIKEMLQSLLDAKREVSLGKLKVSAATPNGYVDAKKLYKGPASRVHVFDDSRMVSRKPKIDFYRESDQALKHVEPWGVKDQGGMDLNELVSYLESGSDKDQLIKYLEDAYLANGKK